MLEGRLMGFYWRVCPPNACFDLPMHASTHADVAALSSWLFRSPTWLACSAAADMTRGEPPLLEGACRAAFELPVAVALLLAGASCACWRAHRPRQSQEGLRVRLLACAMPVFTLDAACLPLCALIARARQGKLRRLDYEKVCARFALEENAHGA